MTLSRVGGRDDRGLDLRGTWLPPMAPAVTEPSPSSPPSPSRRQQLQPLPQRPEIQVYVQCKVDRKQSKPRFLRELEGTLGITATPEFPPIGILASTVPCTPGLRKHMLLSRMPLAYCCIAPYDRGGHLLQFLWNNEVANLIGRGVGVTTRYICEDGSEEGEAIRKEAVLTVHGQIVG